MLVSLSCIICFSRYVLSIDVCDPLAYRRLPGLFEISIDWLVLVNKLIFISV